MPPDRTPGDPSAFITAADIPYDGDTSVAEALAVSANVLAVTAEWAALTVFPAGTILLGTASDSWDHAFGNEIELTSGAMEPDWSSLDPGGSVFDGDATWFDLGIIGHIPAARASFGPDVSDIDTPSGDAETTINLLLASLRLAGVLVPGND